MFGGWEDKKVLITVRTYPVPAQKGVEVSCTAGITDEGKWIRLFPVPFRYLDPDKRFAKYQWITVSAKKASDPRTESYNPRTDKILVGASIDTKNQWQERWNAVRPLIRKSLCQLRKEQPNNGATLGVFKPAEITKLVIKPAETPNWTSREEQILRTPSLFQNAPGKMLEKIPFEFTYHFRCNDDECNGHKLSCHDWEMAEAYRRWSKQYGKNWQQPFRNKFETEMIQKFDTHFFVGNTLAYPTAWLVVGLFYPPYRADPIPDLFSAPKH